MPAPARGQAPPSAPASAPSTRSPDAGPTQSRLREITPDGTGAVLRPLRGYRRYNAISVLRSLFRFAKRHGQIFAAPARHPGGGRNVQRIVPPMTGEQIHAGQQAAVSAAQRLAVALGATRAARPEAIRELIPGDTGLPSRRITIVGHPQPEPSR